MGSWLVPLVVSFLLFAELSSTWLSKIFVAVGKKSDSSQVNELAAWDVPGGRKRAGGDKTQNSVCKAANDLGECKLPGQKWVKSPSVAGQHSASGREGGKNGVKNTRVAYLNPGRGVRRRRSEASSQSQTVCLSHSETDLELESIFPAFFSPSSPPRVCVSSCQI